MNDYLKMDDCVELEEYATKNIGENCSFKALNARGEIIGVAMNGIIKKPVSVNLSWKCDWIFTTSEILKFNIYESNMWGEFTNKKEQENTKTTTICNFTESRRATS